MAHYAAFLRGVSPMNAKMPVLKACFESAGFTDVRTLLSSGNVVFTARTAAEASLARRAEAAMDKQLGRTFMTIVRSIDSLRELLVSEPYRGFRLPAGSKRVITFLREPPDSELRLPIALGDARILCVNGNCAFSAYVPSPGDPKFMALIEKTLGKDVTTRTWETVEKVAG